MQLNHESFEDMVGAYALDACDEDETAALDAYVAEHPEAYAEVERLRGAAAWLGASGPLVPPIDLRTNVLAGARVEPASGRATYQEITDGLEAELGELPADAEERTTANGLTVRELVAHLDAVDRAFLAELRAPTDRSFIGAADIEAITRGMLRDLGDTPFADVVAAWNTTRGEVLDAAAALPADHSVMGWGIHDALVIRSFEAWTHLDDVRRVRAREGFVPDASVLRSLAEFSMTLVPLTLMATDRAQPGRSARIVLTGPGGRDWTVPLAPGEEPGGEPDVVVRADMLEWCHRFSDRLEAEEVRLDVSGDLDLARDIVAAAPVFTGI
jgi:hypothetical protein